MAANKGEDGRLTAISKELKPEPPKKKRGNPNWVKGGISPNPGGVAKNFYDYRAMIKECFPKALEVIKKHLDSDDDEVSARAARLVVVYTLGKEPEPADVQHADAIRARVTTLMGVVSQQLPVAVVAPVAKTVESSPLPIALPPPGPPEATDVPAPVSAPSGLRCLYKLANGERCSESATDGKQWCDAHLAKLFAAEAK